MSKTSELWWVSVGGSKCEPAQVVTEKIEVEGDIQVVQTVFTIGCGDGTSWPDRHGIELVKKIDDDSRPLTAAAKKAQQTLWEKQRAADAKRGIHHGYRTFP